VQWRFAVNKQSFGPWSQHYAIISCPFPLHSVVLHAVNHLRYMPNEWRHVFDQDRLSNSNSAKKWRRTVAIFCDKIALF
jgi:hypothetical protein